MNTAAALSNDFRSIFKTEKTPRTFFAPGRINLIGEHTDYNGGHVFPASISFGTYALGVKRDDQMIRFYSKNFPDEGIIECSLSDLAFDQSDGWANYPKGMFLLTKAAGHQIVHGADILYYGNIPHGAGLSSSASIELATGVLLKGLYDLQTDTISMVKLGQKVENEYIGVGSGIMDQFAIGMGKKDHAILLDCRTLDYTYAPFVLKEHDVIIINTNKQRTLAGSKYNERRAQCEEALGDLQQELSIASLGELTMEGFEAHQHLIRNEINQKRAKHAVYENARTLKALEKLREGDLAGFGKLMNESHLSLRDDYEVTGLELDAIVQAAWEQDGVLGARMTGAGFGGCAIAIVEKDRTDSFKERVNAVYRETVGYDAAFYTAAIGDGAKEI
ncbi:galactokinase [Bacillus licheniformis]|jgi:galactokinase|uniref:Galactokinase n=1 Tax=Bacillus licheniformis TaxID=1402 RepID=A0A415J9K3_BACLI|nr:MULTISPECIES: galactokinase [Bacillus]MBY8348602.1 galactokinase [Bacillus sp. PCH94]MDP4081222.1 galactokinase [Bacillota bacterium]AKQ75561.1 galactokinase [Bacillus licheniformis WX-02]AMR12587.1 galactokinase [Bacillus licheniformis]APJ29088.1 galactokinase [Bacillus sp. H15-1]